MGFCSGIYSFFFAFKCAWVKKSIKCELDENLMSEKPQRKLRKIYHKLTNMKRKFCHIYIFFKIICVCLCVCVCKIRKHSGKNGVWCLVLGEERETNWETKNILRLCRIIELQMKAVRTQKLQIHNYLTISHAYMHTVARIHFQEQPHKCVFHMIFQHR